MYLGLYGSFCEEGKTKINTIYFKGRESLPNNKLFPYQCWVIFFGKEGGIRGLVVAIKLSFLSYKALSQRLLSCMNLVSRVQSFLFYLI